MNPLQRIKTHMNKPVPEGQEGLYLIVSMLAAMILFLGAVITLTSFGVIP